MKGLKKTLTSQDLKEAIALWLSAQGCQASNVDLWQITTGGNVNFLKTIDVTFDLELQPVQMTAHLDQKQLPGDQQ